MHQFDGTRTPDYRAELAKLQSEFNTCGVDLARLESAVLRRLQPSARAAIRARQRYDSFQADVQRWRRVQPLLADLRSAFQRSEALDDDSGSEIRAGLSRAIGIIYRLRPPYYAPDDGAASYGSALAELKSEATKLYRKRRNDDPLPRDIEDTVRRSILAQLHPDTSRIIDPETIVLANRLTARYARFRYPSILGHASSTRISKRKSRERSVLKKTAAVKPQKRK